MIRKNKIIKKIIVLALCINILSTVNVFAKTSFIGHDRTIVSVEEDDDIMTVIYSRPIEENEEISECYEQFKIDKSTGTITGYDLNVDDDIVSPIIIPSKIQEVKVTNIGNNAFSSYMGLHEIVLPDTIEVIGKDAFAICENLNKINLPNKLKTIEKGAFKNCINLEVLCIPNSVTEIGKNAFGNCLNTKFQVNSDNVKRLLIKSGVKESQIELL